MVEIQIRPTDHADSSHHPLARRIALGGEGEDLGEAEPFEPVRESRACRLRREALPPRPAGEPPTDLHVRAHRSVERGSVQPRESGESSLRFDRPQTETVVTESRFDAIDQSVGLLPVQGAREETHHLSIGVQLGERRTIGIRPSTEHQAFGCE